MEIKTTYKTNVNGTAQIVAKGGGKQRTINVDHSKSLAHSHGVAAGTLALVLGLQDGDIAHQSNQHDTVHIFTWQ